MLVSIPFDLRPASILKFSIDINRLGAARSYEFDFGRTRWFPPFSMLLLSIILRRFRVERSECECRARNYENHKYAAYIGFFQSFGANHGNLPGDAPGNSNYVPIQQLSVGEILREASQGLLEVGDVVEAKARQLSSVLTQTDSGALFETLSYAIREIVRNAVEHSGSNDVFLCAQHWPRKNEVEVGIADSGIGVRKGLAKNPTYRGLQNRQAIEAALSPGVSGNPRAGTGMDAWQNSGYGLYMTNRICRSGGSFLICSGDAGIEMNAAEKTELNCNMPGTAVRLLINTERLLDLKERLRRFRDEGRRAAQDIKGANRSSASTASQMLSVDFDVEHNIDDK